VRRAAAVYLSLAQHPPELAVLSLRTGAAVRSALGAGPRALLRWTLRRWAGHVARAALLALPGVVAAGGLVRLAGAERAHLPVSLYLGVVALVALAALSVVVPAARQAGRVDPAASLSE